MSESVFLSPKSIAVVGASDKQGSVGKAITSNIMNGYKGTVYPITVSYTHLTLPTICSV